MKDDYNELPLTALDGLLNLFRRGNITQLEAEREGIERYMGPLTARWDNKFPDFPKQYFPYTSFKGEYYRSRRDTYLKNIVVRTLADYKSDTGVIVNAACVFGRHACYLASRLAHISIVGADIQPAWHWAYRLVRGFNFPDNYTFIKDNVFASKLDVYPIAVVFFGACGSVTDGSMDYAINSGARYLVCRTCCHDNIGGNISVVKRSTSVNRALRLKNWSFKRMIRSGKYPDFYFSDKYPLKAYPRSEAAGKITSSDELLEVAKHSTDSDICRAIIDLDRYLYLTENGYSVLYQGELFFAEKRDWR